MNVHPADALKFRIFLGHLPRNRGFFFRVFRTLHYADALDFLGTFTQAQGLFFSGFRPSCRCSRNSTSSWDIYLDNGVVLFLGFPQTTSCRCSGFARDIYPDRDCFFRVWLFWCSFPHTTSSSCSAFARDIYPDTGVISFGFSTHYIIQMLQHFLGPLHGHGGCFFWGFPHTTSSSCSSLAQDIYLDRGCFFRVFRTLHHPVALVFLGTLIQIQRLFFIGFSAHCIIQLLRFCLGNLSGPQRLFFLGFPHTTSSSCSGFARDIYLDTGVVFFGSSAHCIIQLLLFCSGNLSGHRGCFFQVFCTLHRPVASVLFRTFIQTQGLFFFLGFPHTASSSCSGFAQDIYPDAGVGLFRLSAHYIIQSLQFCSGYLPRHRSWLFRGLCTLHHPVALVLLGTFTWTGVVFFRFSANYIVQLLCFCSGHLPGQGLFFSGFLQTTLSSCSAFARDIYLDTGVGFFGFSAHYIIQSLRLCSGYLPGHRSWLFRVFHTLHHPDAPAFLGTFTCTWGLFSFGFSAHYIIQLLRCFSGH